MIYSDQIFDFPLFISQRQLFLSVLLPLVILSGTLYLYINLNYC